MECVTCAGFVWGYLWGAAIAEWRGRGGGGGVRWLGYKGVGGGLCVCVGVRGAWVGLHLVGCTWVFCLGGIRRRVQLGDEMS